MAEPINSSLLACIYIRTSLSIGSMVYAIIDDAFLQSHWLFYLIVSDSSSILKNRYVVFINLGVVGLDPVGLWGSGKCHGFIIN